MQLSTYLAKTPGKSSSFIALRDAAKPKATPNKRKK